MNSHNDPHAGNILIRDTGNDLIFIDYDQAAFGYRAWDLLYYLSKWSTVRTVRQNKDDMSNINLFDPFN